MDNGEARLISMIYTKQQSCHNIIQTEKKDCEELRNSMVLHNNLQEFLICPNFEFSTSEKTWNTNEKLEIHDIYGNAIIKTNLNGLCKDEDTKMNLENWLKLFDVDYDDYKIFGVINPH